jgi:hypothetical protein
MSLWIVEGYIKGSKDKFTPVVFFPGIDAVHFTREEAREAARQMQAKNCNNKDTIRIRYRAMKYVPKV